MTSIEQVFTTKVRKNVYSGNRDRHHRHVFFLKGLRSNVSADTRNPDLGRVENKVFLCARAPYFRLDNTAKIPLPATLHRDPTSYPSDNNTLKRRSWSRFHRCHKLSRASHRVRHGLCPHCGLLASSIVNTAKENVAQP